MALTFTKRYGTVHGDERVWVGSITYDNSYLDNGESIAASDFGLNVISYVEVGTALNETSDLGLPASWDQSGSKIRLFTAAGDGDPLDEVDSAFDASGYTSQVRVWGS